MKIIKTSLPGVVIVEPDVHGDARGYFFESYSKKRYESLGIGPEEFVQDNISFSARGVLRGLHFQHPNPQGKLVHVLQGEVFDVAVDIRRGSPTFGKWVGDVLSSENRKQLYVPPDFAHGFVVLSETALYAYKCTDYYDRHAEASIAWNDPEIGIRWPVESPALSQKDLSAPTLARIDPTRIPVYPKGHQTTR